MGGANCSTYTGECGNPHAQAQFLWVHLPWPGYETGGGGQYDAVCCALNSVSAIGVPRSKAYSLILQLNQALNKSS